MATEQQPQSITAVGGAPETVREQDKLMLVLAYLGILALIPLLTVKDSPYVTWHAKNGLVLGIGGGIVVSVAGGLLGAIPVIGWLSGCGLWVAYLVIDLMAMMKALKGERWRIPGVTDLAEKF